MTTNSQPQALIAGANAPLPTDAITIRIISNQPIDCAIYRLTDGGRVRGDGDMVFYGQMQSDDGNVQFRGHDVDGFFDINLGAQPAQIQKLALAFSSANTLAQIGDIDVQILHGNNVVLTCQVKAAGRSEKALIIGECYRRQGAWKFRFISQGFDGGLKPLSEHFGVEIADDDEGNGANGNSGDNGTGNQTGAVNSARNNHATTTSATTTPSAATATVNLSKISLTKNKSSINLSKKDNFGKISINLNWNQHPADSGQSTPKKGLLADLFKSQKQGGIDLDVGAMIHLKSGEKTLIQALGGRFGSLTQPPYVCLRGDDRTGQVAGGEWLDINGAQWAQIQEVFIFAFIYEGVPNWAQTDGVVSIYVPEQPPIETRMSEGANAKPMCAIARLVNQNGSINVERINQYFSGHKQMDKAFGWGFRWAKGKK